MPISVCDRCGSEVYWRNTRGSQSPKVCKCGGALKAYRYSGQPRLSTAGRKMEPCALCGRRRSVPGGGKRVAADTDFPVSVMPQRTPGSLEWTQPRSEVRTVKAGAVVCWHHDTKYPTRIDEPAIQGASTAGKAAEQ